MSRAAQIYEFNLTANQVVQLLVTGGFYKLLAASGNVKVTRSNGSTISPLLPGQGERVDFEYLTIQDTSGAANVIDILVADESFVDTRIYGNVSVIDGGRVLSMAENCFGGYGASAPSPGLYSHSQLWNPGSRTKFIAVEQVWISSYAGSVFQLRYNAAALSTLFMAPQNKKLGAVASTAECRHEQNAGVLGTALSPHVYQNGNAFVNVPFKAPIIIPPGSGLIVVNGSVNTAISAAYDFYEFIP